MMECGSFFLFVLLFLLSGVTVSRGVFADVTRQHPLFLLSSAFFYGLMLFITLWVGLAFALQSSSAALHAALAIQALTAILGVRGLLGCMRTLGRQDCAVCFLLGVLVLLIQLRVVVEGYGHLEEFYKLIADYVVSKDRMPILGLHYGQSLLGAGLLMLSGLKSSVLLHSLWLAVSSFFLAIMTYGLFKARGMRWKGAFAGAVCVLLWNPALSLANILFFSTGNPLLFIQYPDDMLSLALMVQVFCVAVSYFRKDNIVRAWGWIVFSLVLCISTNIVAPHNIIVICFFLLFLGLSLLQKDMLSFVAQNKHFLLFSVAFVVLLAAGTRFGGPYSPLSSQTRELKLPTLSIEENSFSIRPGFSYLIRGARDQNIYYEKIEDVSFQNVGLMFWHLENAVLKIAKVLFFPTLGLLIALVGRRMTLYPFEGATDSRGDVQLAASNMAVLGILFFISYGAFDKFGFTKLLLTYYYFGVSYFFLYIAERWRTSSTFNARLAWVAVGIFPFLSAYHHFGDVAIFMGKIFS